LDQLALLPDAPERSKQELEFLNSLGEALYALKGPGAPEMGLAYARGLELWTRLGSPAEFLDVPYGRLRSLLFRGELASALGLAEDLLRLSRQRDDTAGLVQGHFTVGRTLMFMESSVRLGPIWKSRFLCLMRLVVLQPLAGLGPCR
jgi:hypothetical protein